MDSDCLVEIWQASSGQKLICSIRKLQMSVVPKEGACMPRTLFSGSINSLQRKEPLNDFYFPVFNHTGDTLESGRGGSILKRSQRPATFIEPFLREYGEEFKSIMQLSNLTLSVIFNFYFLKIIYSHG